MTTDVNSSASAGAQDYVPYFYLLSTMALFGSAFASSKFVVGELPHSVAAVLRFGGGAVALLLLVAIVGNRGKKISLKDATRSGLVGLLGVFAYNLFFFWGLSVAPSLDGAFIVPVMSPVLTTAYLVLAGRETASRQRILGLVLAVAGAAAFFLSVEGARGGLTGTRLGGDFIFLLGAVSWSAYTIISKRVLVEVDPLRATTCGTVVGALALLVFALPALPDADWAAVSETAWLNVVYLAVGPTAVAYLFYYRGLRSVPASTATIMMFAVPIFGTLCATLFLGESFNNEVFSLGACEVGVTGVFGVS